jgi:hypothetical protein
VASNKAWGYLAKRHLPTQEKTLTFISNKFKRLARDTIGEQWLNSSRGEVLPLLLIALLVLLPSLSYGITRCLRSSGGKRHPRRKSRHHQINRRFNGSLLPYKVSSWKNDVCSWEQGYATILQGRLAHRPQPPLQLRSFNRNRCGDLFRNLQENKSTTMNQME